MKFHIDAASAEGYAFGFEAKALLDGGVTAKLDFSAGAEDTMPGQSDGAVQGPCYSTCGARMPGSAGHVSVRGNFPAGNSADRGQDVGLHGLGHGFILAGFCGGEERGGIRTSDGKSCAGEGARAT